MGLEANDMLKCPAEVFEEWAQGLKDLWLEGKTGKERQLFSS